MLGFHVRSNHDSFEQMLFLIWEIMLFYCQDDMMVVNLGENVRFLHCNLEDMSSNCGNSLSVCYVGRVDLTLPRPTSDGSLVPKLP